MKKAETPKQEKMTDSQILESLNFLVSKLNQANLVKDCFNLQDATQIGLHANALLNNFRPEEPIKK